MVDFIVSEIFGLLLEPFLKHPAGCIILCGLVAVAALVLWAV